MVYVRTGLPRSIPRVFGLVLAAIFLARGGLPAYGQVPQNFQDLLSLDIPQNFAQDTSPTL